MEGGGQLTQVSRAEGSSSGTPRGRREGTHWFPGGGWAKPVGFSPARAGRPGRKGEAGPGASPCSWEYVCPGTLASSSSSTPPLC